MSADVKNCTFVINELKTVTLRAKDLSTKLNDRVNNLGKTLDMAQQLNDELAKADDELRAALATETNGPPTPGV